MRAPRDSSIEDRLELHREKMRIKATRRAQWYRQHGGKPLPTYTTNGRGIMVKNVPAGINRHTGKPHEDARAIARRLRQSEARTNA